jgi:hypothetical protein
MSQDMSVDTSLVAVPSKPQIDLQWGKGVCPLERDWKYAM